MFYLLLNDVVFVNSIKLLVFYSGFYKFVVLKFRRIICFLEEIEDEDGFGVIKSEFDIYNVDDDEKNVLFSSNYYECNFESMKFKMEELLSEGDWEGGLIELSVEQDDDVVDDVIQI